MKNHVDSTANNKSNNKLGGEINKEIGDIMSEDTKVLSIKANLEDAKNTAYSLLDKLDDALCYHNKKHTTDLVVPSALAIAETEGFSWEDKLLICISASFHDTGFIKQYNENESIGAEFAEAYMRTSSYNYSEEQIQNVKDAIENTNTKNPPKTKYARVLRDADVAILGQPEFGLDWDTNLMKEYKMHTESPMNQFAKDRNIWGEKQLQFIKSYNWFTNGAKILYEKGKQQNIIAFKKKYQVK